jgi:hypothetical protein
MSAPFTFGRCMLVQFRITITYDLCQLISSDHMHTWPAWLIHRGQVQYWQSLAGPSPTDLGGKVRTLQAAASAAGTRSCSTATVTLTSNQDFYRPTFVVCRSRSYWQSSGFYDHPFDKPKPANSRSFCTTRLYRFARNKLKMHDIVTNDAKLLARH